MSFTLNYKFNVTENCIRMMPEKPISCVKLRDQYKQHKAEINIHSKAQELAGRILELKKQKRSIDKSICRLEKELEGIFELQNINEIEIDMGVIRRRKTDTGIEWFIEI